MPSRRVTAESELAGPAAREAMPPPVQPPPPPPPGSSKTVQLTCMNCGAEITQLRAPWTKPSHGTTLEGVTFGDTAPAAPEVGHWWFRSDGGFRWIGTTWLQVTG